MEYWWAALVLGLMGSFHCLGMCGPIAFALPLRRRTPVRNALANLTYQSGRVVTYAFLGLLAGAFGKGFSLAGLQQYLSIFVGILMIVGVVFYRSWQKGLANGPMYRMFAWVRERMFVLMKRKTFDALFSFGIVNGLLPCGLVYMALAAAISAGSGIGGAVFMALFGLGTMPMMFAAGLASDRLSSALRIKLSAVVPVVIVLLAMLFILRGMGLGIPYVSPKSDVLELKNEIHDIGHDEGCH
jgi:sulfite exporter TauE/SafE